MQLHATRHQSTIVHQLPRGNVQSIIGRKNEAGVPNIDLSPDPSVSRRHARIWLHEGKYWIEDLGSRLGTLLNGTQINGTGPHPYGPEDELRIGKTSLRLVDEAVIPATVPATVPGPQHREPPPSPRQMTEPAGVERIAFSADMAGETSLPPINAAGKLLQLLQDVVLALGRNDRPADVARMLVRKMLELIKGADRAALLLVVQGAGDMVLAAHEPEGDPRVSATLVRQAIEQQRGLVWLRALDGAAGDLALSIEEHALENVLCAPLMWKGECLGALWLAGSSGAEFARADLDVVVAVSHHIAMAVAAHRLQEKSEQTSTTLQRIMRQFSPRVAIRLLEQASQGRLRPGGMQSQVTLLCCDLRGFTNATADMAADDVVDMLNVYFAELVAVLLRHGGTVDKFIGDAILAVFGSPEADPQQHANAVLAAREMQESMHRLNIDRVARNLPALELGIGIHCGTVLHGFIGSEERFEFTVIGDAVNKTSRYCDGAGGGEVLISPELHQLVWRKVKAKRIDIDTKHEGKLPVFVLVEK